MSALTDLFTSLANKIRSKLGTSITYTPTQAISAIDDVYTAGYNKGYEEGGTTHTQTYTANTKSSALDMGIYHSYRYVNSSGIPNTNSGTYTYTSGSTGGTVDLGETNTYRYVNAANVYAKGKTDGHHTVSMEPFKTSFSCNVGDLIILPIPPGAKGLTITGANVLYSATGTTGSFTIAKCTDTTCTIAYGYSGNSVIRLV